MDKWFNSKWFVRAVSLAFAILLYVFVNIEVTSTIIEDEDTRIPSDSNEVQTLNDVPVDIQIDNDKYVVSGVPEYITVRLGGPNSILVPIVTQRNFEVFVDLRGLEEGTHTVDIEHAKIPDELEAYVEPKTAEITIEERASEEFPVTVDYIDLDELPDGYELGEVEVNPDTITITSSKNLIEQVAMVKIYIDVAGLTEPINNREVPVNVMDSQGNGVDVSVDPERVVVSMDVDNPSKTVSIEVDTTGDLPDGYELTSLTTDPEEIEVFAPNDSLDELDELWTEEIDLSTITSSDEMEVELIVPDGAMVEDDTIMVNMELDVVEEFEEVSIDVENLEDGQDIQFLTPDEQFMSVSVEGAEEEISDLTEDDFNLSIDVEGLSEGEHEVPVSVDGPEDVNFEVEFEEVTINIT